MRRRIRSDVGAVDDEDQVELGRFRLLGQLHIVAEVHTCIGLRIGVTPSGNVVSGLHEECTELDLFLLCV